MQCCRLRFAVVSFGITRQYLFEKQRRKHYIEKERNKCKKWLKSMRLQKMHTVCFEVLKTETPAVEFSFLHYLTLVFIHEIWKKAVYFVFEVN